MSTLFKLPKKQKEVIPPPKAQAKPTSTYIRKYYLHRQVKKAAFTLELQHTHKTIGVEPHQQQEAQNNKYVQELQKKYSYGVQIINPLA